jgi:hypothetical protein
MPADSSKGIPSRVFQIAVAIMTHLFSDRPLEAKLARGEDIDIAQHALLCSTLVRVALRIGVDRIPRDVSPSLSDILRGAP